MKLFHTEPETLEQEFEKFWRINHVCNLLSNEINNRYLIIKSNLIGETAIQQIEGKYQLHTPLVDLETAYKLATADWHRQIKKITGMIIANI